MQGAVYSIRIQGHAANEPHPHVVLLEFDQECLVIPCFTAGGHDLEERLVVLEEMSFARDVVSVELDNASHVKWTTGRSGHRGCWCIWRFQILSKRILSTSPKLGQMDDRGMLALFQCLLRYAEARPELFAKKRIKRIRELAASYADRCKPPEV
jgi:hypothetical protein